MNLSSEAFPQMTEFDTFEAREAAFNAAVGQLIPARYRGPQRFWHEFRQITEVQRGPLDRPPAFITSNPRDCLAFGTVGQVLAAARWRSPGPMRWVDLERVIADFRLLQALQQPLRTLSGGETVRLALAKAMLAADNTSRLVIASPFCWLSRSHLPLLDKVLLGYAQAGKPVEILLMHGEACQDEISQDRLARADLHPQSFRMQLQQLRIDLGTPINTITAQPAHARVEDFDCRLRSPCLLVGDNGQGKSLVAKALCGAMGSAGTARVASRNAEGRARLLFQDVVSQTLLRSFHELGRVGGTQGCCMPVEDLFRAIWSVQQRIGQEVAGLEQMPNLSEGQGSLLAVKTVLIAARLAHQPAALILDEPDWGLSREAAIGLVLATVQQAHQMDVPVMVISHKPWWRPVAGSVVQVSKTETGKGPGLFEIRLQLLE
jgi:energy-coupling factor transporter ATP-binding protein EcfA2